MPATDPLARAVTTHRPRTRPLPRMRALCGHPTPGGPCHFTSRHPGSHLPLPTSIRRPDRSPRP